MAQYTYDMFRFYPFLQFDFILLFLRFYFRYFLNFCVFALAVFRWILSNCRCIKTEFLLYGTRTYATMCVCVREHTRCRAWWCDMFRFHYPKQNIAHGVQVTQSHTNVYAFASYIISREFHDSLFLALCHHRSNFYDSDHFSKCLWISGSTTTKPFPTGTVWWYYALFVIGSHGRGSRLIRRKKRTRAQKLQ